MTSREITDVVREMQVEHLTIPVNGRLLVVGDLLGQKAPFESILDVFGFDPAVDIVASTGNLIDSEVKSQALVKLLSHEWFRLVLGPNEIQLLHALRNDPAASPEWRRAVNSWPSQFTPADLQLLSNRLAALPDGLMIEWGKRRIGLVHAGVRPGLPFERAVLEADRDLTLAGEMPSRRPCDVDFLVSGRAGQLSGTHNGLIVIEGGGQIVQALDVHACRAFWATAGTLICDFLDIDPDYDRLDAAA